jgi:hypothetical protein
MKFNKLLTATALVALATVTSFIPTAHAQDFSATSRTVPAACQLMQGEDFIERSLFLASITLGNIADGRKEPAILIKSRKKVLFFAHEAAGENSGQQMALVVNGREHPATVYVDTEIEGLLIIQDDVTEAGVFCAF